MTTIDLSKLARQLPLFRPLGAEEADFVASMAGTTPEEAICGHVVTMNGFYRPTSGEEWDAATERILNAFDEERAATVDVQEDTAEEREQLAAEIGIARAASGF